MVDTNASVSRYEHDDVCIYLLLMMFVSLYQQETKEVADMHMETQASQDTSMTREHARKFVSQGVRMLRDVVLIKHVFLTSAYRARAPACVRADTIVPACASDPCPHSQKSATRKCQAPGR